MEYECDELTFIRTLVAGMQERREAASANAPRSFPWGLTLLGFVKCFVFDLTPFINPNHVGWSLLESWLQVGLVCHLTLTLSRSWEGKPSVTPP